MVYRYNKSHHIGRINIVKRQIHRTNQWMADNRVGIKKMGDGGKRALNQWPSTF